MSLFDEFMKSAQKDPKLKGKIKGVAVIDDEGMRKVLENPANAFEILTKAFDTNSDEKPAEGIITHVIKEDGVDKFIDNYQDGDIDRLAKS